MISSKSWNISNSIRRLNNREGSHNRGVNWANKNTRYETTIAHEASLFITFWYFCRIVSDDEWMTIPVHKVFYTDVSRIRRVREMSIYTYQHTLQNYKIVLKLQCILQHRSKEV